MTAIIRSAGDAKQYPASHFQGSPPVRPNTHGSGTTAGPDHIDAEALHTESVRQTLAAVCLLLLAAILYLSTLDNGLQPGELHGGDLITHQYAQVQARPSNAPGYPIYTMGGWLWFHSLRSLVTKLGFPYPNPIPILSSYSTIWALLSLWLLFETICITTVSQQQPRGNWPVAFLIAAFYSVTYFFWYYATTTEQYSSAVAQTLAILYVYLLWRDRPQNNYLLYLLALLSGLSLAHMLTVALMIPPLIVVVVLQKPDLIRKPRVILLSFFFAALPLLSYIYIYVRGSQHPEWRGEGSWTGASEWFWSFVSTAQGREELMWGFEPGRAFFGNGFPELIVTELSIVLVFAGILGIALLERRTAFLLYTTLALYLVFSWAYRYGNWFQVILPAYPLLLVGVASLADRWQCRCQRTSTPGHARGTARAPCFLPHLLLIFAIGWRAMSSLPEVDSRDRPADTALHNAAILLDQPIPDGTSLFAAVDDALALQYLSDIWKLRPDLDVVSSDQAATRLESVGHVFSTWQSTPTLMSELPDALQVSPQSFGADWVVLSTEAPVAGPPVPDVHPLPQTTTSLPVVSGLSLIGYTIQPAPTGQPVNRPGQSAIDVVLYWRLHDGEWPEGLSVSLRPARLDTLLTDAQGNIIHVDRNRPVHGLFVSQERAAGRDVLDGYRLRLDNSSFAEIDSVVIIAYTAGSDGFDNVARLQLPIR